MIEQKISPRAFGKLQEKILRGEIMGEDVTRRAMEEINLLPVPTRLVIDWKAQEDR